MKLPNFKSINIFSITGLVLLTCWNGSMVNSGSKDKRLDVNFYGTLNDKSVEDISINGKYKDIFVYASIEPTPKLAESAAQSSMAEPSPTTDKIALNLENVAEITLKHPKNPIEHEIKINNKKYIEIMVKLINGSHHTYMIESDREISALIIDKGPNNNHTILSKEIVKMPALKKLTIKSEKAAEDVNESRIKKENHDTDKITLATNIENDLDQIAQAVDNLPKHDASQYEKFKDTIASLLRSLRNQLQKMLNLIKN